MQLGIFAALGNPFATKEYVQTFAREAEACGFASIWIGEHTVMFDPDDYASKYPYDEGGKLPNMSGVGPLDQIVSLAVVAGATERIRLGTGICILPQHNPVDVAKHVATLDWLSAGRVDFGVGIGWLREEFAVLGAPWPGRAQRTEEYLEVIRSLWYEDPSSHDGELYSFSPCHAYPKPVQSPLPVFIGGESDAALRRTAKVGDGWYGMNLAADEAAACVRKLEEYLTAAGRRRGDLKVVVTPRPPRTSADGDVERQAYEDAGVDELVLAIWQPTIDGAVAELRRLAP